MKLLQWISTRWSALRHTRQLTRSYEDVGALTWQGYTQLRLEDYEKARNTFLQALQHRDELKSAGLLDYVLMSLDSTWLATEDYGEGITFFSEYIDHYPSDSAAYCGRAAASWYSGKLEDAMNDYSRAVELVSDNILALSGRGQILAEMGSNEKALTALDLALRSLKNTDLDQHRFYKQMEAFVHRGLGIVAAGLGKNEQAMTEFDLSITLSPENAWVYYSRAQIRDRLGSPQSASSDYQLALGKRNPALTQLQKSAARARLRELQQEL
jgi:tetratricopeptide (TPR) repeat protein